MTLEGFILEKLNNQGHELFFPYNEQTYSHVHR
jgi:hypothetical protein